MCWALASPPPPLVPPVPPLPPTSPPTMPPPPIPPTLPPMMPPPPELSAGDCMVVGYNVVQFADAEFAIVLLAPLGQGYTIFATDAGWRTDIDGFDANSSTADSHVSYTATADVPAGTVLTMTNFIGASPLSPERSDWSDRPRDPGNWHAQH
eukprot:6193087-Prymnesium_polylepis.1